MVRRMGTSLHDLPVWPIVALYLLFALLCGLLTRSALRRALFVPEAGRSERANPDEASSVLPR